MNLPGSGHSQKKNTDPTVKKSRTRPAKHSRIRNPGFEAMSKLLNYSFSDACAPPAREYEIDKVQGQGAYLCDSKRS